MAVKDLKIHMPTAYKSSYEDAGKRVVDKYPGTTGQSLLPEAWAVAKQRGLTADQFANLMVTGAEILDACWKQEAPNNLASGYQNTYTKVILPKGRFPLNFFGNIARGGMVGEGSFGYMGQGSDQGQVATEFVLDDVAYPWIERMKDAAGNAVAPSKEHRMFQTPNADRTDNQAYNESFELLGIRLTCAKKMNDGIARIGWFIKRAGSTSWMNQLQANGFNKGFVFTGGVPLVAGTIRAFECDTSLSCEGTWGATIVVSCLEVDGSKRAVHLIAGPDGAAGAGMLDIFVKTEDGVTAGVDAPGLIVVDASGQYVIDARVCMSYQGGVKPQGAAFILNPTIGKDSAGNEMKQSSLLRVIGKGFGYGDVLVKNALTGKQWSSAGDYAGFSFEHYAANDTLYTNCPTIKQIGGSTPTPSPTPDPTPTPTPDPGTKTAPQTLPAFSNAQAGGTIPANVANVRAASFKGLKWTATSGAQSYPILATLDVNGASAQVKLLPDGTVTGPTGMTATPKKLVKGAAATTLNIAFGAAVTVKTLLNGNGSWDAFQGSATSVELT